LSYFLKVNSQNEKNI